LSGGSGGRVKPRRSQANFEEDYVGGGGGGGRRQKADFKVEVNG